MRVLLFDLDTLRADHMSCYGYPRPTTPNLDSVAAEGVRFNDYYCSNAPCLPSRSALMSGQFGFHTGVTGHGGTAADRFVQGASRGMIAGYEFTTLPALFRNMGMRTALISPFGERHSAYWVYAGFNEMYNTGKHGNETAEEVSPIALKWLDEHGSEDNWYLHVNFWDAHAYYRTPMEYGDPFDGGHAETWVTQELLDRHRRAVGPRGPLEPAMFGDVRPQGREMPRHQWELNTVEDVEKRLDGYDIGIQYMDYHIGLILDKLREKGIYDEVKIIITADHGENFGELGIYSEHATADEATCHIPMIIKWNEGPKGIAYRGLHYNLDLLPTLAELTGQPKLDIWDGRSYAKTILEGMDTARDHLVLEQDAHVCQRSVRFDRYIYIRTYHDGYHLFERDMLFDLEDDPHELCNLASRRPDLTQKAASLLLNWHDEMMWTHDNRPDPLWTTIHEGGPFHAKGHLEEYLTYLDRTGRSWAEPELTKRHPGEFGGKPDSKSFPEMQTRR